VVLLERKYTSDVDDVVKTHFIYVITLVRVVDFLPLKEENTLGSSGIHKCKKLIKALNM